MCRNGQFRGLKVSAELSLLVHLTAGLWYQKRLSHMLCDASEEVRNSALGGMAAHCYSLRRKREERELQHVNEKSTNTALLVVSKAHFWVLFVLQMETGVKSYNAFVFFYPCFLNCYLPIQYFCIWKKSHFSCDKKDRNWAFQLENVSSSPKVKLHILTFHYSEQRKMLCINIIDWQQHSELRISKLSKSGNCYINLIKSWYKCSSLTFNIHTLYHPKVN